MSQLGTDIQQASAVTRRFGGTIPAGADPLLGTRSSLPDANLLFFSHGRAALRWLVEARGPFAGALVCAYTWPTVPDLLERLGLEVRFFDIGAPDPSTLVPAGSSRWLVLIPALFGLDPWLDTRALAEALGPRAMVVVDAAQTAFDALNLVPPPGGAVLSCPHKCTTLGDGSLLALDPSPTSAERQELERRPTAARSSAARLKARAAFARCTRESEAEALDLIKEAEQLWPHEICRMSDAAKDGLAWLDRSAHDSRRRMNAARLAAALGDRTPPAWSGEGVPFCLAVLVSSRDEFLARLYARQVFATPLWPNARHETALHPRAARCARELVGLPVDQGYQPAEMDVLADHVLRAM